MKANRSIYMQQREERRDIQQLKVSRNIQTVGGRGPWSLSRHVCQHDHDRHHHHHREHVPAVSTSSSNENDLLAEVKLEASIPGVEGGNPPNKNTGASVSFRPPFKRRQKHQNVHICM